MVCSPAEVVRRWLRSLVELPEEAVVPSPGAVVVVDLTWSSLVLVVTAVELLLRLTAPSPPQSAALISSPPLNAPPFQHAYLEETRNRSCRDALWPAREVVLISWSRDGVARSAKREEAKKRVRPHASKAKTETAAKT